MNQLSRRAFMATTPLLALPACLKGEQRAAGVVLGRLDGGPVLGEAYPSQDPQDVQAVVGASHAKLDEVTAMVNERATLAKAAWDWGFGDWETALGAASHTGRRDIAEVLIAHGARPDLFTHAMFGHVDVVRAICTASPGAQRTPGPHGITLLRHAQAGGEQAHAVVEYLMQLGGADEAPADLPLDEAGAGTYVGKYEPVGMPFTRLIITWSEKRRGLSLQRDDRSPRNLLNEGQHLFHPVGAPLVRVVFNVIEGLGVDLTIHDGNAALTARRLT